MKVLTDLICRCLLLITVVAVGACQTQPSAPPSADALARAAQTIIIQAAQDFAVFNACSALGGETGLLASDTREVWQFNNEQLLDAAAVNLARQQNDWVKINDTLYSLTTVQMIKAEQASVLSRLNLAQRGPDNQKITCDSALSPIESRRLEQLLDSPQLAGALRASVDGDVEDRLSVDHHIAAFPAGVLPGRSYFSVFESLTTSCADGELELDTLINDWPEEYYSALCRGEPSMLIYCQWAECHQQQPEIRTTKSDSYDRYRIH